MSLNESLYQLFLSDQQVRGLEGRLDGARRYAHAQQTKLQQLHQQKQELEEQLRQARATEHSRETEAEQIESRIETLRERMNNAHSNKEYSSLLVEVNTLKNDKSKLEDQALELMNQIEDLKQRVEQVDQQIAEQEKVKAAADRELQQRQDEVGDQLEQAKHRREQAAEQVPSNVLKEFDRLAEATDGEAMVPIEVEDARRMEYTCGGCFMAIPVEKLNQLMSQDELVQCSSCNRILYLGEEVRDAMGIRS